MEPHDLQHRLVANHRVAIGAVQPRDDVCHRRRRADLRADMLALPPLQLVVLRILDDTHAMAALLLVLRELDLRPVPGAPDLNQRVEKRPAEPGHRLLGPRDLASRVDQALQQGAELLLDPFACGHWVPAEPHPMPERPDTRAARRPVRVFAVRPAPAVGGARHGSSRRSDLLLALGDSGVLERGFSSSLLLLLRKPGPLASSLVLLGSCALGGSLLSLMGALSASLRSSLCLSFAANHSLALCEFSLLCGKVLTDLAPGSGLRGGGGLP